MKGLTRPCADPATNKSQGSSPGQIELVLKLAFFLETIVAVEFIPARRVFLGRERGRFASEHFFEENRLRLSILAAVVRPITRSRAAVQADIEFPLSAAQLRCVMKFVCLGYYDETKFSELPQEEAQRLMDECLAYDDELRRGGHFLGGEALSPAPKAVTLKMRDGEVEATDGPFSETKEVLGGILLLEARDIDHAVALMSKHPGVKIGPFEIRPADEEFEKMVAERSAAMARKP